VHFILWLFSVIFLVIIPVICLCVLPVVVRCHFLRVHPGIRLVPCSRCLSWYEVGIYRPRMRLMPFVPLSGWYLSLRMQGRCISSQYEVGVFRPVLVRRHLLSVRPSIRSVPFYLATSMYPAYRIQHSNLLLLVLSTSCFSPHVPV